MKTIVYATDFSTNSLQALGYAYFLSEKTDSKLIVLHVFDSPSSLNGPEKGRETFLEIKNDDIESYKNKLKDFCESYLGKDLERENIQFEVRENRSTIRGIVTTTDQLNTDLLVVGTKGKSLQREILMGSTSKGIIKESICPVLLVPPQAEYKEMDKILYATNYKESDIVALNQLSEIAELFISQITVLHLSGNTMDLGEKNAEWFRENLKQKVHYPKIRFEQIAADNIYAALNNYLIENDISLIVMLETERKSLFDKWFHRDLVVRMELHTSIPMLVFNEKYLSTVPSIRKKKSVKNLN